MSDKCIEAFVIYIGKSLDCNFPPLAEYEIWKAAWEAAITNLYNIYHKPDHIADGIYWYIEKDLNPTIAEVKDYEEKSGPDVYCFGDYSNNKLSEMKGIFIGPIVPPDVGYDSAAVLYKNVK